MTAAETPARPGSSSSTEWELVKAAAIALGLFVVGPLALLAALLLALVFHGWLRVWLWLLAVPAAVGGWVAWPSVRHGLEAAAAAIHGHAHGHHGLPSPTMVFAAAWPHLWPVWILTMSVSPPLALLVLHHRGSGAVFAGDRPAGDDRARRRLERRRARRAQREPEQARTAERDGRNKTSLFLGYRLSGDPVLPTRRGRVALPLGKLAHHVIVAGATGSGKTETVLRLSYSLAACSDWEIVYIDGKGDEQTRDRFAALMRHAGRDVSVFPAERYDGWRGTGSEVANRLLQLIDFADEGGGAYYRDLAVAAVHLACQTRVGPPRSSRELLRRLDAGALQELHAGERVSLRREDLEAIRARYAAFFTTVGDSLDGSLSFDRIDTGYFLLDGLRLKLEAARLARFLVEEFTQWAVGRKPRNQRVLLVVDEFSAIAQAGQGLVDLVERARGFGVACVLCPQVADGMGGPEAAARIIGSAQTILLHATAIPSALVDVAGTRQVVERSHQLDGDSATGLGSARLQHAYRVDLQELRQLKTGQCFAISRGRAMKLQITPAPSLATLEDSEPELQT